MSSPDPVSRKDFRFRCVSCRRGFNPADQPGTCPDCGPMNGTLDVEYDFGDGLRESDLGTVGRGIFRFTPLLPLEADAPTTPLRVGDTPLYESSILASRLGIGKVWVKDDGGNPSASLKDRATAVALSHAASLGRTTITAASTGNAASSLATLAASMALKAVIFVPDSAPRPKVAQMLLADATVIQVHGTYDQAFDLCTEAAARFGWYSRSTAINPYLAEGKKTCAFEIAQALNWKAPDWVAVGVGDGCVFGALHKGFSDLVRAGLAPGVPRLLGVQAVGCAPLVRAFHSGKDVESCVPDTYADSIAVGVPRDRVKALRAARKSQGGLVAVSDDRIREAVRLLASRVGVFAEPAGAAGLAGLLEHSEKGRLHTDDTAVVIVSGHGLKDTDGAITAATKSPMEVQPGEEGIAKLEKLVDTLTGGR